MNPETNPEVTNIVNPEPVATAPVAVVAPAPVVAVNQNPIASPTATPEVAPVKDKRRHFLAAFFFSFLFGVFGVDRFYLGKFWTGLLKLLTFGGFGIWAMIDLSLIMSGAMRDKQGNELIDSVRYKKFAKRTVWGFTIIVLLIVVAVGAISVYIVMQIMQNGGLDQILKLVPGFDKIQGLQNLQGSTAGQKMPSAEEIQTILSGLNLKQ